MKKYIYISFLLLFIFSILWFMNSSINKNEPKYNHKFHLNDSSTECENITQFVIERGNFDRTKYQLHFYQDDSLSEHQKFFLTIIERSLDCNRLKIQFPSTKVAIYENIHVSYSLFADLTIMRFLEIVEGRKLVNECLNNKTLQLERKGIYTLLLDKFNQYKSREIKLKTFRHDDFWHNEELESFYTDLQKYNCHLNSLYHFISGFEDSKGLTKRSHEITNVLEDVDYFELAYLKYSEDGKKLCEELLMDGSGFDTSRSEYLAEFVYYNSDINNGNKND